MRLVPTPSDYNDAVQQPKHAFSDPILATGMAECNTFGIPKAFSGGFAITIAFKVTGGYSRCAVSIGKRLAFKNVTGRSAII